METRTFKDQLIKALQNTEDLPEVAVMAPIPSGHVDVGKIPPAAQAVFTLALKMEEERKARAEKTHTDHTLNCVCKSYFDRIHTLHTIFLSIVNEEFDTWNASSVGVHTGWRLSKPERDRSRTSLGVGVLIIGGDPKSSLM